MHRPWVYEGGQSKVKGATLANLLKKERTFLDVEHPLVWIRLTIDYDTITLHIVPKPFVHVSIKKVINVNAGWLIL